MKLRVQEGQKGREWGEHGLTVLCFLQTKYQDKEKPVKSASCTIHTSKSPKQIIEMIKKALKELES